MSPEPSPTNDASTRPEHVAIDGGDRPASLRRRNVISTDVLANPRRALGWSIAILVSTLLVFVAVGRHPPATAPVTTLPFVGEWDGAVYRAVDEISSAPLGALTRLLHIVGSGVVMIPLRAAVTVWLLVRRRWRAFAAWALTWATAEIVLASAKAFFHRGRPPGALVATVGYSFPSGHAVAGAATAVALVLVLLPAGPSRRRWEFGAIAFAFLMAFSRVYLLAHWLSDVTAGVLLGTGIALAGCALVTQPPEVALGRGEPAPNG